MEAFTLSIKTVNAAFHDGSDDSEQAARQEVARILRDVAKHVENGSDGRRLCDSNGNSVGEFNFQD
jgi:hypothetical protein